MSKPVRSNPWMIVALLFVVALLNYFDRQSLSVVAPRMQAQLHLSDTGYGHIVSLFLLASAFAYALSGFVSDAIGTRKSMTLFVAFWSLAEAATAFASSIFLLGLVRFCLGLGEPGLWVAAPKAVGEMFEKKQRSLAIGIYTMGATVGAVVAIPTIVAVTVHLPWRSIFLIDGAVGLLWVPVWWFLYRDTVPDSKTVKSARGRGMVRELLARPETWQLLIARGMTDPVWYFYLFWFPKYLLSVRHLTDSQMANYGWVVYLGGGVGTLVGGLLSGTMIRRGMEAGLAYRRAMSCSAVLVLISPFAFFAPSLLTAVLVASVVALAHMAWLINLTSVLLEVFPLAQVGKAAGFVAAGSALGGMVSSEIIAYFVTHGGYRPVFFLMAIMHPLALGLLWTAFRGKPLESELSPLQENLV
ncbi:MULTISPECIES: MFS transporter [Acidobacteriaceae]|uniref:MFS transporter n=1 Tax=Acidobacteriaceae TaxID=204434 RepID=UPI00131E14BC|nr:MULTISPECIES: MFS transporter [Acidobacteriaceae]MDW5266244.1 MFS transporter [Edaphobacter sp.]